MEQVIGLVCVILIVLAIGGFFVALYNGLVRGRNAYRNAFAQIDVQLTRRHDLIPNLVEVAKGYIKHERETLEAVVAARNAAMTAQPGAAANPGDPAAMQQLAGAENVLTQTLGRLFALSEAYPDLKANTTMMQLFARQAYNDAVMSYSNRRETFPSSMVANMFGFGPAALFQVVDPGQREAPRVSF